MRLNLNVVVFALAALVMLLGYEELAMLRSYARRQILKPSGVDRSHIYRGASQGGGDGDSDSGSRTRKVGPEEEDSDEDLRYNESLRQLGPTTTTAGGDDGDKGYEEGASAWTPRAARALRAFARETPEPASEARVTKFTSTPSSSISEGKLQAALSWTKRPPRERCPDGACGHKGVCVADTGECRCSLGWVGDACERPDPQPCNDPSFPNVHFSSRCAGVCDVSANKCVCGGGGITLRLKAASMYLQLD